MCSYNIQYKVNSQLAAVCITDSVEFLRDFPKSCESSLNCRFVAVAAAAAVVADYRTSSPARLPMEHKIFSLSLNSLSLSLNFFSPLSLCHPIHAHAHIHAGWKFIKRLSLGIEISTPSQVVRQSTQNSVLFFVCEIFSSFSLFSSTHRIHSLIFIHIFRKHSKNRDHSLLITRWCNIQCCVFFFYLLFVVVH